MSKEVAGGRPPLNNQLHNRGTRPPRALILAAITIFILACSVRLLSWHDTRLEVGKVQSSLVGDYQRIAQLFEREGLRGFFSSASALADLNNLGHPPGCPIVIALIQRFGGSQSLVQFVQIIFDAAAAVVIFLLVAEFFSLRVATLAGFFAAIAPQMAWNSVLLLPDSLAVFPILLAVYLLARARRSPRLTAFIIAGALLGISCWLRANAMLLTVFFAVAVLSLLGRKSWRYSLAVVCGTLLIVLPLTIRNAVVFHRFIPLSLGAGQTFLEGIADYDPERRFGVPNTDLAIMRQEAEIYQRPDYYGFLFKPDGAERERWRLRRGLSVIGAHPIWFASVMTRRAASMLRLERVRLMSSSPAITHSLDLVTAQPRFIDPADLLNHCSKSDGAKISVGASGAILVGNGLRDGIQVTNCALPVTEGRDYIFESLIRMRQGRVRLAIHEPNSSQIVEPIEGKQPSEQPAQSIQLPFVSRGASSVEISNEASNAPPVLEIDETTLYDLGPARFLWMRYPRALVRAMQRLFITAVFLPLALVGLGVTIFRKQAGALVILSVVPVYYCCVQSAFHTEYRYVLAVNYFLFAFAAVAIVWLATLIKTRIVSSRQVPAQSNH